MSSGEEQVGVHDDVRRAGAGVAAMVGREPAGELVGPPTGEAALFHLTPASWAANEAGPRPRFPQVTGLT